MENAVRVISKAFNEPRNVNLLKLLKPETRMGGYVIKSSQAGSRKRPATPHLPTQSYA